MKDEDYKHAVFDFVLGFVEYLGLKVDLIIPGLPGYELLKKIREASTLREIPVVIMS
ncbi:unnamed protein product [Rhodiola kirilowii]